MASRVLILGSAPDALRARDWPRDGFDAIVAINNAWAIRPDWTYLTHPSDFPPERRPPDLGPGQRLIGHEAYVPAVNDLGGFVYVGGAMVFTAACWTLRALAPRMIAFLGCDMIYPAAGPSHFYGRGNPDPLRADPTLQSLEGKSARFLIHAAEAGCLSVNLSELPESRLALPRLAHEQLVGLTAGDAETACAALLGPQARALAAQARAEEARLGYAAPDGRYWKRNDSYDAAALRRIDDIWRAAAACYSGADGRRLAVT